MRKRAWVLLMLAMGAFLLAGGAGALGLPDAELPPPKDYAYRNGKVFIGGDVVVPCRIFASEYSEYVYPTNATSRAQAERVLEQCEQAGHEALADTGGMPLMPVLAAGALALLVAGGLVATALVSRS